MRFVCHTKCVDTKGQRWRVGQEADWDRDDPFTKWWIPLAEAEPEGETNEGVHEPQTLSELQAKIAPPIVIPEAPKEPEAPVQKKAPAKKPVRRGRR